MIAKPYYFLLTTGHFSPWEKINTIIITTLCNKECNFRTEVIYDVLTYKFCLVFNRMAAQQSSADISNISELDSSSLEAYYTGLNLNFSKFMEEMELDHQQVRNQLQRGFNPTMRSEAKRLKTFPSTSNSFWMATEMAAAGFYYNNVKSAIQCFCCGLVLLKRSSKRSPFECHKNLWSSCEFILGKEVGNISKYDIRVRNPENNSLEVKNKYKEMESRLESFTNWPFYCKEIQPALLSNAGFYFTGNLKTFIF